MVSSMQYNCTNTKNSFHNSCFQTTPDDSYNRFVLLYATTFHNDCREEIANTNSEQHVGLHKFDCFKCRHNFVVVTKIDEKMRRISAGRPYGKACRVSSSLTRKVLS